MKISSRWLLLSVVLIGTTACTGNGETDSDDIGAAPLDETSSEESSAGTDPSATSSDGPADTEGGILPPDSEGIDPQSDEPQSDEEPLAVPPLVIDEPEDAGVVPGPSTTPEPDVSTSVENPETESSAVENTAQEPEPAVMEPETIVPPEPAVIEPETVVPPEPAVIEPETMVTATEPDVVEPEPDPCANVPQCDVACTPGTSNPLDENGCVQSCECEADPNGDWCVEGCAGDEQCVQAVPERSDEETRFVCADLENDCDNTMACGCLDDYDDCTISEETGLCACPALNPCGSCLVGQRCIYQQGGQGRYLCATELACASPLTCGCVIQQGPCEMDKERGVCSCDNGF